MLLRVRRQYPGKEGFVGLAGSGGRGGKASHCGRGCSGAEEPSEDRQLLQKT